VPGIGSLTTRIWILLLAGELMTAECATLKKARIACNDWKVMSAIASIAMIDIWVHKVMAH